MINAALVLEGGGLRSLYTAGILDVLIENQMEFAYVIGVSAGALTGINYITKQRGRSASINISNCDNPEFLGLRNFILHDGIFNMDFLFDDTGKNFPPVNMEAYLQSKQRFTIVATSCDSGKAIYFENPEEKNLYTCLRASSSMPLLAKKVLTYEGLCLDGGIGDSVPFQKALSEGFEKIVVVRTREDSYRKSPTPNNLKRLYQMVYKKYPHFIQTLINRPEYYNQDLNALDKLQDKGELFVFSPEGPVTIKRDEKDKEKLRQFYKEGHRHATNRLSELRQYLK